MIPALALLLFVRMLLLGIYASHAIQDDWVRARPQLDYYFGVGRLKGYGRWLLTILDLTKWTYRQVFP